MKCKDWKKWTAVDDELLRMRWSEAKTKEDLTASFPGRTYNSLMLRAGKLGVKSGSVRKRKNGSLELLIEKNLESFYLWGFIMADGHVSDCGSVFLNQLNSERKYIERLYSLLGGKPEGIKLRRSTSNYNGEELLMCQGRIGHKQVIDQLRPLIGLSSNKTYTPPIIEYFFLPDIFFSFFIGMLDGDGSIWISNKGVSSPTFQMTLHLNWLDVLNKMSAKLFEYYGVSTNVKTTKNGYALIECADQSSMRKMYELSKSIPIKMERKWSKLAEYYQ